jgi:hypothetical protein
MQAELRGMTEIEEIVRDIEEMSISEEICGQQQ